MRLLVDNGHGIETKGKRSPDGMLQEWAWTREVAALIVAALKKEGIDAGLLVTETRDVSLYERVRRVNCECKKLGAANVTLLSIHVNAAGSGSQWLNARGFLPYVSPNAGQGSKRFARMLYEEIAEKRGLKGNRWISKDKYAVKSLAMCRETMCAAVLTENRYMDNREDCAYLLTDEGKANIVEGHVAAVRRYLGV